MKRFLILISLFTTLLPALQAQSTDSLILNIRARYNYIVQSLPGCDTTYTPSGYFQSTEGGEAVSWYKGDSLLKIEYIVYGEMYKSRFEYFFEGENLIFMLNTLYLYNVPIYDPGWNESQSKITENRYYFHADKLIRWLDENKKAVSSSRPDFQEQSQTLLRDAKAIRALVRKPVR